MTDVLSVRAGTEFEARQRLARLPITQPPGLFGRLMGWGTRRFYGQTADNGFALAPHKKALLALGLFEWRLSGLRALDEQLKALAVMTVSLEVGCSWCVDFGLLDADRKKLDLGRLQEIPHWRTSQVLSDTEKRVVEFAQAATATPPTVTDEMVAALRTDLGDKALIELVVMVAVENERSRVNAALGLVSQGFSASCQVPAR